MQRRGVDTYAHSFLTSYPGRYSTLACLEQKAAWTTEPLWTLWRKDRTSPPGGNQNTIPQLPKSLSTQFTDYVYPAPHKYYSLFFVAQ